ncbi:glucosyltransferase domain-containing protein [Shigella sonnei]|nr:glucosyltransferase domain-containing protein [Shigella sonnei]
MISKFYLNNKKIICLFFILAIFYPFSTTLPFWDDESRFAGEFIWLLPLGRVIPELYYRFFTFGDYVVDLQIFNILIISFSFYVLLNTKATSKNWFIILLFLSSPFLSENLLYHVDGVAMLLAYFVSIYAAFYYSASAKKEVIVSFFLFVFAILSYQAALNSFALASCVYLVITIRDGKRSFARAFVIRGGVFIFGTALIKFIASIAGSIYNTNYLSQRSTVDLSVIHEQVFRFYRLITNSLPEQYLAIFVLILFTGFVCSLLQAFLLYKEKEYYASIFMACVIPLAFLFMLFPYILVDSGSVVVARTLYGFGGIIALLYALHTNASISENFAKILSTLLLFITAAGFSVYASSYNKKIEIELETFRKIEHVVNLTSSNGQQQTLIVCNSNPLVNNNPIINKSIRAFPFIKFPDHASTTWENGATSGFLAINSIDLDFKICKNASGINKKNLLLNRKDYKLYLLDNNEYLLEFSN